MTIKTPDYVLEAHFKTLLRKARLFDWIEARIKYAEFSNFDGDTICFDPDFFDDLKSYIEIEINNDPDFQWLKD